jgi:hypothetical protein
MILVRQVFQTHVGKSRDVAGTIMQSVAHLGKVAGPNVHGRVLTDISGPFGTVVLELEVESLAAWEQLQAAMAAAPQSEGSTAGPSFTGGHQEFYTLEGTF